MIALVRAETERLLSRRMTRFFPLGLAGLVVVGVVISILTISGEGPDFVGDIAAGQIGGPDDDSTLVLGPMGFLVPIMAFVIGASYFGADQKSGMIEQLLTWEPRRTRLLAGRLLGGMPAVFVITALLSLFLVCALYVITSVTGSSEGAFDIWAKVLGAIVRSGITGAIFFALGLGVTVITNNSVGSIVGFLIYVFLIETALLSPLLPKVSRWLPMENADAFVSRFGVGAGGFFSGVDVTGSGPEFHHGWVAAGLLLAAFAAIVCLLAATIFTYRDID